MTSTLPGLTVFCPVFNEEEIMEANIRRLMAFLDALTPASPYEVIIGSNGSNDRTVEIAQNLAREFAPRLTVFHLPEKGVGKAFAQGVETARYDRIVTVDMDLSIDMGFIPQALELLDRFDIVIGSKVTGDQKRPWIRKSVSNLFIQLARVLLNIGFHDYSIAAKAYRTPVVKKYLPYADDLTFYVVKIVYFAARDGHRITEVPVSCHDMRESRFNLIHEGFYKFGNLFLLWVRKK
ncbi:glycosyl transferase family 2 [Desulfatibacillum aliphaticivorans]|uniref:Glycosyl transferase family 2 n=1 Tax=Desulfatibacillum aliphaticivorans TaxID=218208 RepID=B8FFV4_DESAL|nr:glycosyltransferase family 2 protein [Desulfatibacillum aliphaticivorans]ACL03509.1 glycosyl transferase family 2 [Desulfatibacillum aliphaticivorans]